MAEIIGFNNSYLSLTLDEVDANGTIQYTSIEQSLNLSVLLDQYADCFDEREDYESFVPFEEWQLQLKQGVNLQQRTILPHPSLDNDHYKEIFVSHSISPLLFWIQLKEDQHIFDKLSQNLNLTYDSVKSEFFRIKKVFKNAYVAAKFSVDHKWYRARVLSVNEDKSWTQVFYVDYGNIEEVNVANLRVLSEQFMNEPAMAIPFTLANARPRHNKSNWNDEEIQNFNNFIINKVGEIWVKKESYWPIKFCCLSLESTNILDYLLENKIAEKTTNDDIKKMRQEIKKLFY